MWHVDTTWKEFSEGDIIYILCENNSDSPWIAEVLVEKKSHLLFKDEYPFKFKMIDYDPEEQEEYLMPYHYDFIMWRFKDPTKL